MLLRREKQSNVNSERERSITVITVLYTYLKSATINISILSEYNSPAI